MKKFLYAAAPLILAAFFSACVPQDMDTPESEFPEEALLYGTDNTYTGVINGDNRGIVPGFRECG